jgi:hypothetical protein
MFSLNPAPASAHHFDLATLPTVATRLLIQPSTGRLAALVGEVTELYSAKSYASQAKGYASQVKVTTSLRKNFTLDPDEDIVGFTRHEGERELLVGTCPNSVFDEATQRATYSDALARGPLQWLRSGDVTDVLEVRGQEYNTEGSIEALLVNWANGEDFDFFGWAVASVEQASAPATEVVHVYRRQDGWVLADASELHYQRTFTREGLVYHSYDYGQGVAYESYTVTSSAASRFDHDLGCPLTAGQFRKEVQLWLMDDPCFLC